MKYWFQSMWNLFIGRSEKAFMALLLLSLVVFLSVSEWSLRRWVVPIANTEANRAASVFKPVSRRVVIGDSHVYRGFLLSDGVTNLGRGGTSIPEIEEVLRAFYRINPPGELVIGVSHQFFSNVVKSFGVVEGGYDTVILARWLYLLEPVITSGLAEITAGLDFRSNINALEEKKSAHDMHRSAYPPWSEQDAETRGKAVEHRAWAQKPVWDDESTELLAQFDRLIQDLRDTGVSICLLRTPLTQEYLQIVESEPEYSRAAKEFRAIAQHSGIPYIDFRDLDIDWKQEMFINQDHIQPQDSANFARAVWKSCFGSESDANTWPLAMDRNPPVSAGATTASQ